MQKGSHHSDTHVGHSQGGGYDIGLWTDPVNPQSSKPSELSMIVTEQQTGGRVGQFEIIHEKLMHLVVVSDDLSYFAHVHPKFNDREKVFAITHTFPAAGRYRMWVDVKPKGAGQLIKKFDLNVDGKPARQPIPIVADRNFAKDIVAAGGQKYYQVQLKVPERINAGKDTEIVFELSDSQGRPITDLEPLMAAGGHCVIISSDAERFLHVHPIEEVDAGWRGGPKVVFRTNFPSQGLYKTWGQFQHRGNIITVDFVLQVKND